MYKVVFNPTADSPRKEEWFDAESVQNSPSGGFLDFVDRDGRVLRRFAKGRIATFGPAVDRRQKRQIDLSDAQVDRRVSHHPGREPHRPPSRSTHRP